MEIKLVEWFDDHFYKVTTESDETIYIPSVTTKLGIIAKPFLARWRGDIGNREADYRLFEAQERGVRIHHGWYTLTTGGAVIYQPPRSQNYKPGEIEAIQNEYLGNVAVFQYQDEYYDVYKLSQWLELVKPNILASELNVYSLIELDAGTVDNVMEITEGEYLINGSKPLKLPGGRYVVDLKTGNQVDDNAFMQTAAYAKCLESMAMGDVVGTLIIHTGAKTKSAIEGLATLYRNKDQMEQDYQDYRLAAALWERKNADRKPKVFEFPAILTMRKETENV